MSVIPRQDLKLNTLGYEQWPLVKASGFREYDARWVFEQDINLEGVQAVGLGLATLLLSRGGVPSIIVGHDFRSYSGAIKQALMVGLMNGGVHVHDIGMAMTPMAYFAQFACDIPAVAMVTASHNDNGWTGIKMGLNRPLTFGPDEMLVLKNIVMNGLGIARSSGQLSRVEGLFQKYKLDLLKRGPITRRLKVIAACGNGTAGAFAPEVLRGLGCVVIEVDCELDHRFPNYNPNPEDMKMLRAMSTAVTKHGADLAFGFDGDGDRCGVVDNEGHEIFADKVGVMLARDIASQVPGAQFVVDIKSTGLYKTDPVLVALGATVDYYKTGHSYIKQRTTELNAVAGFEKSGHFFFRAPYGHGYDDGLSSAIAICRMLDRAPGKSMAELYRDLPQSFTTPTMSPQCADEEKYGIVDDLIAQIKGFAQSGHLIAGQKISEINTVNGVRFGFADGSWGLIRASSNKPELVVVCESFKSNSHLRDIFDFIETEFAQFPAIGAFNQKISS